MFYKQVLRSFLLKSMEKNIMINVKNITKRFKDFEALSNLTLEVPKGEIYGLLGSNGAGKSTTINILLGFLEPDSGESFVNGINTSTDTYNARKNIGYIPENVNLYPYLTGIENLDYFCKLAGKNYSPKKLSETLIASSIIFDLSLDGNWCKAIDIQA